MTGHEFDDEDQGNEFEASSSPGDIIYLIKDRARKSFDISSLKEVAFNHIHLPSLRVLEARRDFFSQLLRSPQLRSDHRITLYKNNCNTRQRLGWFRRKSHEFFGLSPSMTQKSLEAVIDTPTLASNSKHQLILSEESCYALIIPSLHLQESFANSFDLLNLENHKTWNGLTLSKEKKTGRIVGVSNDGQRIWCISTHSTSSEISSHPIRELNSLESEEDQSRSLEVITLSGVHPSVEMTSILKTFLLESLKYMLIISADGLLIRKSVEFKDKDDVICYCKTNRHQEHQHREEESLKQTVIDVTVDRESSFIYLLIASVSLSSNQTSFEDNNFQIKSILGNNNKLSIKYKLLIVDLDSLDVLTQIELNNEVSPVLSFHVVSQEVVVFASVSWKGCDDYPSLGVTGHFVKVCHSQDMKQVDLIASENNNCIQESSRRRSLVVISLKSCRMTRVVCEMETKSTLLDLKVMTVPIDQDKRCKMKLFMNHHDLHVIILLFSDAKVHVIQSNGSHFIAHHSFDLKGKQQINEILECPESERGLTSKTLLDSAKITGLHLNTDSSTLSMTILSIASDYSADKSTIPLIHDTKCKLT
jgi:hypothetical protein